MQVDAIRSSMIDVSIIMQRAMISAFGSVVRAIIALLWPDSTMHAAVNQRSCKAPMYSSHLYT